MTPEERARVIIDEKLQQSGWIIQDMGRINISASLGVAVREYPTSTGPVDYALFVDGKPVGVVEAKKDDMGENITIVEGQSGRYANSTFRYITTPSATENKDHFVIVDEMNETLYDVKIKPPILHAENANKYEFATEDDGGTGMRYKGMILLDLALLRATSLPFVIHDSLLLPNIENEAIEKILELYTKQTDKQVFLAFDKTATPNARKILEKAQRLHLSRGGNELFGKAWNRKENRFEEPNEDTANSGAETAMEEQ